MQPIVWVSARVLTRTSRGLRTGYAYQPPVQLGQLAQGSLHCVRTPCPTRTSLGRAVRTTYRGTPAS